MYKSVYILNNISISKMRTFFFFIRLNGRIACCITRYYLIRVLEHNKRFSIRTVGAKSYYKKTKSVKFLCDGYERLFQISNVIVISHRINFMSIIQQD